MTSDISGLLGGNSKTGSNCNIHHKVVVIVVVGCDCGCGGDCGGGVGFLVLEVMTVMMLLVR